MLKKNPEIYTYHWLLHQSFLPYLYMKQETYASSLCVLGFYIYTLLNHMFILHVI